MKLATFLRAFVVGLVGIDIQADNTNITLTVPDAYVVFTNGVTTTTTIFTNGEWITYTGIKVLENTFASGLAWQVPFNLNDFVGNCWGRDAQGPYRRSIKSATWCGRFTVSKPRPTPTSSCFPDQRT